MDKKQNSDDPGVLLVWWIWTLLHDQSGAPSAWRDGRGRSRLRWEGSEEVDGAEQRGFGHGHRGFRPQAVPILGMLSY